VNFVTGRQGDDFIMKLCETHSPTMISRSLVWYELLGKSHNKRPSINEYLLTTPCPSLKKRRGVIADKT
jgi:hypothetical protein